MTDRNDTETRNSTRRKFLELTGLTLTGLGASASATVAGATADSEDVGPTTARTTVIKRFSPDGEHFELEKRAVSPRFDERFGGPVLTYDPEPVPREAIPEEYTDPDRPFTVQYEDDLVVGTLEDQLVVERREGGGDAGGTQTQSQSQIRTQTQSYDGPQYVYESASGAEGQDIYERTAPINVAWGASVGMDASQLRSYMENRGWQDHWTMPGSGSRYILSDGQARAQDDHIYKEIYYTRQWHIRVYDVTVDSSVESLQVVGNVHRDPLDHNHVGDEPWYFDDAREETTGAWESWGRSSEYVFTGGTMWETHDGNLGVIHS
ncbi:hypothetical protein [Halomontanus rarus]|uniref:hypothetical protein n=1 Tax=Halomontanus rarus TaxID=3034020 RepID=UPI001A991F4C